MTLEQAIAFLVFAIVASATPGPSNIMLTAVGANAGVWRGLPAMFGASVGMGAMIFIVAVGFGQIIVGNDTVMRAMNWLGIAFLLWLSWKIASAPPAPVASDDEDRPRPLGFFSLAAFQWVNPKSWIVSASAAATYLKAGSGETTIQAAALGLLFVLAATPGCFVWLAFGAGVQHLLRTERAARTFNIAMGLLLAASLLMFVF